MTMDKKDIAQTHHVGHTHHEIGDANYKCGLWTLKQQLTLNTSALWNFYCSPKTFLYCPFRDITLTADHMWTDELDLSFYKHMVFAIFTDNSFTILFKIC